jgi:hypothetical protein
MGGMRTSANIRAPVAEPVAPGDTRGMRLTHRRSPVSPPPVLTPERRSLMRDQRDLVKTSLARTYPRDVYPLRGVIDIRAADRRRKAS